MSHYVLTLILVLQASTFMWTQEDLKVNRIERQRMLYGFLYEQDTILDWVKNNRADLRNSAFRAEEQFNSRFRITRNLFPLFVDSTTSRYVVGLIEDTLSHFLADTSNHRMYLGLVEERSKGKIASPILESILYIEYHAYPEREVGDGFFQRISVFIDDGIELHYNVPLSWLEKTKSEMGYSGLLHTYGSELYQGNETFYVSARKFTDDTAAYRSKVFQKISYSEAMARNTISGDLDAKVIRHERTKIGRLEGSKYKHSKTEIIGEQKQYAMSISYSWAYQGYQFLLTYQVLDTNSDKALIERHYDRFKNLFTALAAEIRLVEK